MTAARASTRPLDPARRTTGRAAALLGALLGALAVVAAPAHRALAQDGSTGSPICGRVRSDAGSAVSGARVSLATVGDVPPQMVLTPDDGTFCLLDRAGGPATLLVRRIGFHAESLVVARPADRTPVEVRLRATPMALAPVVVHGLREMRPGPTADFYARKANGFGRYITRADILRRNPIHTTDLFYTVPGIAMTYGQVPELRIRGSTCGPEVFVDGTPLGPMPFDFNSVDVGSIEGIEVYSSSATVPVEFTRPFGRSACGTILLWTRQGEFRPRRPKKVKPVTSADLARAVDEARLFTAEQVDVPAVPDADFRELLRLPDTLTVWPDPATVLVEFVVDSAGRVEDGTANIVSSPGALFSDAVRAALPGSQFTAAKRAGMSVRQLVQLSVEFAPPKEKRGGR